METSREVSVINDNAHTISIVAGALFPFMRGIDITVMSLVSKEICAAAMVKYEDKNSAKYGQHIYMIIKKSEICQHADISCDVLRYMIDMRCPASSDNLLKAGLFDRYNVLSISKYTSKYTEYAAYYGNIDELRLSEYNSQRTNISGQMTPIPGFNLLPTAISGGHLLMVVHLLTKGYKISDSLVRHALFNNTDIFEYLIKQDYKYKETSDDVETIIKTNNNAALCALKNRGLSLYNFIKYAADNVHYLALKSLLKLCSDGLMKYIIATDNVIAYKFLRSNNHNSADARNIVIYKSYKILKDMFLKIGKANQVIIVDLIINQDLVELFGLISRDCVITDLIYEFALRKNAIGILSVIGYREHMIMRIIDTNNINILNLFPIAPMQAIKKYAVRHNYKNVIQWLSTCGFELTADDREFMVAMGYTEVATPVTSSGSFEAAFRARYCSK